MRYFDASALVKRYLREKGSAEVRRLLASDVPATSRLSQITITKQGRVVARLVAADDENDRPWQRLRGKVGDPFAPAIDEAEVDALN